MFVESITDFSQAMSSPQEIPCAFIREPESKEEENFEEYKEVEKLIKKTKEE